MRSKRRAAGDSGRGFAVVSNDIRSLAREASDNVERAKDTVQGILDQIASCGATWSRSSPRPKSRCRTTAPFPHRCKESEARSRRWAREARSLSPDRAEILEAAVETAQGARQIAAAAEEASAASREAATAATEQSQGAEDLAAAIEEIASLADELKQPKCLIRHGDLVDLPDALSFLTLRVSDRRYALRAADVAEIVRVPAMTRVPQSPEALLGIANLRGSVLPVASLRGLLGLAEESALPTARAIVLDGGNRWQSLSMRWTRS